MKFYHYSLIIIALFFIHPMNASKRKSKFSSPWVDSISAKITNTIETIMHKEFPKALQLELCNEQGSVIINSWKQDSIAIEIITSCQENVLKDIKVNMEHIDNHVKIHTVFTDPKIKGSVLFNILLPKDTDVIISTKQGDIIIKDINGSLKAETKHGDVKLLHPHNKVDIKTGVGSIMIRTDHISKDQKFTLTADKGDIEIYTTNGINTSIHASALQGKVTSELPVTLDSITTKLDAAAWKNFRQEVRGYIGLPLSTLWMTAHNGSVMIMPYMKQNDIF